MQHVVQRDGELWTAIDDLIEETISVNQAIHAQDCNTMTQKKVDQIHLILTNLKAKLDHNVYYSSRNNDHFLRCFTF
jgi:hypothetical protein